MFVFKYMIVLFVIRRAFVFLYPNYRPGARRQMRIVDVSLDYFLLSYSNYYDQPGSVSVYYVAVRTIVLSRHGSNLDS